MAKHKIDGKGFVSKGQRVSCYGNIKHTPRAVGGNNNNAMREAMHNARVDPSVIGSELATICINAIMNKPKLSSDQQRGWSAHLSFRTFNTLKEQGIMS